MARRDVNILTRARLQCSRLTSSASRLNERVPTVWFIVRLSAIASDFRRAAGYSTCARENEGFERVLKPRIEPISGATGSASAIAADENTLAKPVAPRMSTRLTARKKGRARWVLLLRLPRPPGAQRTLPIHS